MGHDYGGRLARARDECAAAGLDALLITPSADLVYLAGYEPPPLERLTALVVRAAGDPVILVPALERPRAEASVAGSRVHIETWRDGEDPYGAVARLIPAGTRFGASDRMWASHLLHLEAALPGVRFVSASAVMARLRARKDPGEIDFLARAAASADETFRRIIVEGLEGRTEEDVAGSLARHLVEAGHDTAAFTIVASGPNGASPHHDPGNRTIRTGDAVVLDFGGRVGGYCSDITRTVSVREPDPETRKVHEIVRLAAEAAFQAVAPGVPAQDVDRAARRVIEAGGFGDAFVHRTGHGIGLDEHEHPYLVAGNDEPLEVGMCFSIEPGIYLGGRFGVRIEDIVAITDKGATRLNDAPRELVVVA